MINLEVYNMEEINMEDSNMEEDKVLVKEGVIMKSVEEVEEDVKLEDDIK